MSLHRPFARLAALLAASALALTACGSGGDDDDDAAASDDTRTVTSSFTGEKVEIPTKPKRVVALWRTGAIVADLGVKPVATLDGELLETELGPDAFAKVEDTPTVGSFEGVDVEKLIEAKPDLIVGMDNGGLEIDYSEIEKVAPTVILKIAEPTDVWDNYPEVADLLGKSTDYEQKNKDLDAKLASIKEKYGDQLADAAATDVNMMQGAIYVNTSKSLTYRRLDAAGFGYNPTYTNNPERYAAELSAENLPSLASSKVLFYDVDIEGKVSPDNEKLLAMESFTRLPAAQAGHVYPLTSGVIYTFEAADKQVADIEKAAQAYAGS